MAPLSLALALACSLGIIASVGGPSARAQDGTPSPELLTEIGDDGTLTNCIDPSFPPMEYYEGSDVDNPVGFDVDLTKSVAERLGLEAEFIATEFTGLLPALQAGRCDIIASGIYLTPERLAAFDGQPYFDTSIILMTLADNDEISSPDDLPGKTISVQSGTNYVSILEDLNQQFKDEGKDEMNIQAYPKGTDAVQQLIVGRADVTITQDTEAAFREVSQPGEFKIAYLFPEKQTFAIYFAQDADALQAALKSAVEALRDDGTLAGIAETWGLPVEGANYTAEIPAAATPEATPSS
jgi:polar amino acid transport system substrate-binding protein